MRPTFVIRFVVVISVLSFVSISRAAPPVITFVGPDYIVVDAYLRYDRFYSNFIQLYNPIPLPFSNPLSISYPSSGPTYENPPPVSDDSHSETTIDWTIKGDQHVFTAEMQHEIDGLIGAYDPLGAGTIGGLMFVVDRDTPYELSGYFNVTDFEATSYTDMGVELFTFQPGFGYLYSFRSHQSSRSTPNERYEMHTQGGDYFYPYAEPDYYGPTGSTTGVLKKGKIYQLYFNYGILSSDDLFPGTPHVATAIGNFTFKIGEATVPEPASSVLLLSAVATGFVRRRMR